MQMHSALSKNKETLSGKIKDAKVIEVLEKLKLFFIESIKKNQYKDIKKISGYLSIDCCKFNRFGYNIQDEHQIREDKCVEWRCVSQELSDICKFLGAYELTLDPGNQYAIMRVVMLTLKLIDGWKEAVSQVTGISPGDLEAIEKYVEN